MSWNPESRRQARENAYAQRFGTHLPLLAGVIAKAGPGPVFEIGTGHASAPLIAEMCKAMGRTWHLHEPDNGWLDAVQDLGPTCATPKERIAVAFVDCWGWDRLGWLKNLRDVAEFIVIHDTDDPAGDLHEMMDYIATFTYRFDYKIMTPWTTVVSMWTSYP